MNKYFFAAAISAFLLVAGVAIGCSDEKKGEAEKTVQILPGSPEFIKARGKIIIGVFGDIPPFGYIDSTGRNAGFDIAFARRITKDLLGDESKVEFVILDPANRIEYLKSDKVDLVLADFTVTEERKQQVDFTLPYSKVALGVVVPATSKVTKVEDLYGKKLLVNKGTTAEIFFTQNHPKVQLVKFDQNTALFQALKDGRAEGLSQDNTLLFAWTKENPGFKVALSSLGSVDQIAGAVKKGNKPLLDWVNAELVKLGEEKFGHAAYEKELKPFFGATTNPDDVVVEGGKI